MVTTSELDRDANEYSTFWHLPITPRDIAAYGIETNGDFGWGEDEQAELADNPNIVRLSFGVYCDESAGECRREVTIEAFEIHMPHVAPHWYSAAQDYHSASGHRDRIDRAKNEAKMWELAAERVTDLDEALDAALAEYEAAFPAEDDDEKTE